MKRSGMIVWKKWLGRAAIGTGVLMAVVAVGGFFLPARLEVEAERVIASPPEAIWEKIASLKQWPEWAPWWRREPFLEMQFTGPETGPGATMAWTSKSEGQGRAKIISVTPGRQLGVAFDFGERGDATGQFHLEPVPGEIRTKVRWKVQTHFGGNTGRRYFGLLYRGRISQDLEEGLANLEALLNQNAPSGQAPLNPAPSPPP